MLMPTEFVPNFVFFNFYAGLSKELYYVREGVLNSYALQFVVPVPAHVNALHFTWQTLGQKPVRMERFRIYQMSRASIQKYLTREYDI